MYMNCSYSFTSSFNLEVNFQQEITFKEKKAKSVLEGLFLKCWEGVSLAVSSFSLRGFDSLLYVYSLPKIILSSQNYFNSNVINYI